MILATAGTRALTELATDRSFELTFVNSEGDLFVLAKQGCVETIVLELRAADGSLRTGLIQRLRAQFPSIRLIAWCRLTAESARDILLAGREGADDLILQGIDGPAIMRATVVGVGLGGDSFARRAERAVSGITPKRIQPILSFCLKHADSRLTVDSLAEAFGVTRKTLREWLIRVRGPLPSELIGWSRLLIAAAMLDKRGNSVEATALALGLSSSAALRNLIRRYTGLRTSAVLTGGALQTIAIKFTRAFGETPIPSSGEVSVAQIVVAGDVRSQDAHQQNVVNGISARPKI